MIKKLIIAASLLLSCLAPASAQFADQATYAGTGAGSINVQTVVLANVSQYSDLLGVIMKYVPGASGGTANSGDTTLNVNSLGVVHFKKPGASGAGLALLTGNELVNGQPVWIMYDGTYFDILSVTGNSVSASNLSNSSLQFGVPVNLQLNATVSSNNLTIAIKGNNGSDPSATNPVLIPFRDSTITNGDPKILSLQSALSFTINSGNTMGCVSGKMCRLWVEAICSTGLDCTGSAGSDVVALCAFNALSGFNVAPINEAALQTSASGTNGGSSAQTYYCNASAVTGRAIRIVGYVEIQEVTAGTWATGPVYTQLFGPGIKKPGDWVQVVSTSAAPAASVGSSCPTLAAITSGPTVSIIPSSAANVIRVTTSGAIGSNATDAQSGIQIARGSTLIGQPTYSYLNAVWRAQAVALTAYDAPNTTSLTTYQAYGCASTGTIAYPSGVGDGVTFDAVEIMGALPEPANDNGSVERRMVG